MKITIEFNDFEIINSEKERQKQFLSQLLAVQGLGIKLLLLNGDKQMLLIVKSPFSYETIPYNT